MNDIINLFEVIDRKLEKVEKIQIDIEVIKTKLESFVQKSECEKKCKDGGININFGKKKIAIGAGVIAGVVALVTALLGCGVL